ncbi:tRNA-dihydrouridine(20) synthase [NAD(P)+]-like protein [Mactra antiquata]
MLNFGVLTALFLEVCILTGTANAKTALKAAKKIEQDVSAIDINMGCPKEFSLKGGMGAALLKKPETIKEILTTLVKNVSIPVTCKIRLLPDMEDNIKLVQLIQDTGVSALGIHGRLTEERPRHPNRNHIIKSLTDILHIPVIANGGSKEILHYSDIDKFRESCGASSVMIARAAEWNTSIFRSDGPLPVKDVVKEYIKVALDMDNGFVNTKYCILMMMRSDMDQQEGLDTQDSKGLEELCDIWGMSDYLKKVTMERKAKQDQVDKYLGVKRRKLEDGKYCIEMPIRFYKKDYPVSISPKLKLYEWTKRNHVVKPNYLTTERTQDRCFKCVMELENVCYTSTFWEKSKQLAEQAAAIVGLTVLNEDDGRKPDIESANDDVISVWRREFQDDTIYRHKVGNSGKDGNSNMVASSGDKVDDNKTVTCDISNENCTESNKKKCS